MNNDLKISICGDICSECPRYIATKTNDILELEKVTKLWYRLGFRDTILHPEELKCFGCSKDKPCSLGLNNCEHLGSKNSCGECDYFPCDKLAAVFLNADNLKEKCIEKCSQAEYEVLLKACLMKREILTDINENYKRNK